MLISCATWLYGSLVLVVLSSSVVSVDHATSCPTWFHKNHKNECISDCFFRGIRKIDSEMKVEIPDGICVTYSSLEDEYYGGSCPYRHTETNNSRFFSQLPTVPDQVNHTMCAPYNRNGFLCGKCIDGYGPAAYSLDMKCVNCSYLSMGHAITLFLTLELFPSTLLFIFLVLFRLNITVGPLLGYVIFCQVHTFYQFREMFIYEYLRTTHYKTLFKISLTVSQIWSMQFLNLYIPSFCISDRLTVLHIQMLSLVKTIYPVILVIIMCILMELHARNYRIIHILCKPCILIFNKINVTSDAIFHGLASINLLTATNVTYTLCFLLVHSVIYCASDCSVNKRVLFFDTSVIWFSKKHTMLLVPTLMLFILLVLLPLLLLCIYPTRIYKYLLRFISSRKQLAITAFAEALNKCFKDGLNGTRDYRGLPGLLLLCAISTPEIIFMATQSLKINRVLGSGLILILMSLIFSYVQPCKQTIANLSLSYHVIMTGILAIVRYLWKLDNPHNTETLVQLFVIIPTLSHVLIALWIAYVFANWTLSHSGYPLHIMAASLRKCCHWRSHGYQELPNT